MVVHKAFALGCFNIDGVYLAQDTKIDVYKSVFILKYNYNNRVIPDAADKLSPVKLWFSILLPISFSV